MLALFCAALTENKILFYSSSYSQLTHATQAMLALMYPLKFRYRGTADQFKCQGLKNVLSGHPGRVDFLAGQVTIKAHLPNGQGCRQVNL